MRILIVALLLGLATAALAGPVGDGLEATLNGDYDKALKLLTPPAEAGDAEAQFALGTLYADGRGVEKNTATAAKWYRLAADQGHPPAENNLGALYSNGDGVPHDHAEAVKWWALAAAQGFPRSQTNLASVYAEGDHVPLDYVQAYMWATLAAIQGEAEAVEIRDRVVTLMSSDELAEAQRLVREWRPVTSERT